MDGGLVKVILVGRCKRSTSLSSTCCHEEISEIDTDPGGSQPSRQVRCLRWDIAADGDDAIDMLLERPALFPNPGMGSIDQEILEEDDRGNYPVLRPMPAEVSDDLRIGILRRKFPEDVVVETDHSTPSARSSRDSHPTAFGASGTVLPGRWPSHQ